jgi:hypothetical protein
MTNNQSPNNNQDIDDQTIDVIDMLGFLWRARVYVAVGVVIGLSWAFFLTRSPVQLYFVTQIPVTVSPSPDTTIDQSIALYRSLIITPEIANAVFVHLESSQDQSVKNALMAQALTKQDFVRMQVTQDISRERLFDLVKAPGQEGFVFETRLNAADDEGLLSQAIINALFVVLINQHSDLPKVEQHLDFFVESLRLRDAELSEPQKKLQELESSLHALQKGLPNHYEPDDVPLILGQLVHAARLNPQDAKGVLDKWLQLSFTLDKLNVKHSPVVRKIEAISHRTKKTDSGSLDFAGKFAPVVQIDHDTLKILSLGPTVKRIGGHKANLYPIGVLLGIIGSLMVYGVQLFVMKNRDRLGAIFKS